MSLADALTHDASVERELGRLVPIEMNGFVALNTAFFRDGAFISIPPGVAVPEPIHVVHYSSNGPRPSASHPRNLVILGEGSTATIVETYLGGGEHRSLTNAVTEVVLGEGAVLTHCKSVSASVSGQNQAYHVGATSVRQERGSVYTSISFTAGPGLARNDLRVTLQEERADCTLLGLYLPSGSEHVDNHTVIDHAAPHGTSRQLYKGILDGRGRAVFNGRIVVRPGAQQTDARQTNKNVLLSSDATIDTKPQLEILADDVKCSHGATVGQLDPEMLFYLKSRALSGDAARALLTYGFAADVIERVKPASLRDYLAGLLAGRLGAEAFVGSQP
jgi:Fe-S cluster assembly protein SufD